MAFLALADPNNTALLDLPSHNPNNPNNPDAAAQGLGDASDPLKPANKSQTGGEEDPALAAAIAIADYDLRLDKQGHNLHLIDLIRKSDIWSQGCGTNSFVTVFPTPRSLFDNDFVM
jgi:hypothetical protein